MSDPRETFANARVAHRTHHPGSARVAEGRFHRLTRPLADLCRQPGGARDRQVLFGERLLVLEFHEGYAFCRAENDGYVGYVAQAALGPDATPTHRVSARQTHLYPKPDFKSPDLASLSFGSVLTVSTFEGAFAALDGGGFVPCQHIEAIDAYESDPAQTAALFIGTPYLWGGNSGAGIDCSGLVQAAILSTGRPCPRDSDQQLARTGRLLPESAELSRGDLVFWKGHVGMMADRDTLIHANAHHMAVVTEPLSDAEARIRAKEFGPIIARKRLAAQDFTDR